MPLVLVVFAGCSVEVPPPRSELSKGASVWPFPRSEVPADSNQAGNPWLDAGSSEDEGALDVPVSGSTSSMAASDGETAVETKEGDGTVEQTEEPTSELELLSYFEGQGGDKKLTLLNTGAGEAAACQVEIYSNGGKKPWRTIDVPPLSSGGLAVLCTSKAWQNDCTAEMGGSVFNGDDALVVRCANVVVDSFGRVGEDPGEAWVSEEDSDLTSRDALLRRCAGPDRQPFNLFAIEEQWALDDGVTQKDETLRTCLNPQGEGGAGGGSGQ